MYVFLNIENHLCEFQDLGNIFKCLSINLLLCVRISFYPSRIALLRSWYHTKAELSSSPVVGGRWAVYLKDLGQSIACLVLQTSLLCRTQQERCQQLEAEERQYPSWSAGDTAWGVGIAWFNGMPIYCALKTHRWNSCWMPGTFRYLCNGNIPCTFKGFCALLFLRSLRFGLWYFVADAT